MGTGDGDKTPKSSLGGSAARGALEKCTCRTLGPNLWHPIRGGGAGASAWNLHLSQVPSVILVRPGRREPLPWRHGSWSPILNFHFPLTSPHTLTWNTFTHASPAQKPATGAMSGCVRAKLGPTHKAHPVLAPFPRPRSHVCPTPVLRLLPWPCAPPSLLLPRCLLLGDPLQPTTQMRDSRLTRLFLQFGVAFEILVKRPC